MKRQRFMVPPFFVAPFRYTTSRTIITISSFW